LPRDFADQRSDEPPALDTSLERGWRALLTLTRSQLSMLPVPLLDARGAKDAPDTAASR
jgi:V/A-type H+/Na+-transporting ATPase subunit B